jgi:hypothetical protein
MPRVKMNGKVKTLLSSLLLTLASLAYYFISGNKIIYVENGISMIKNENAAPPNGITLYDSFLIDAKIISTIRGIPKQKVDINGTGEKKPKLYLHVGPPKHGTTSLQCALARIQVSCMPSLPPTEQ